jgi:valine--pyruvate aminotransferase
MQMRFSKFGHKLGGRSGIKQLMDDLGLALAGNKDMLMLGGGNPALIPEINQRFREIILDMLQSQQDLDQTLGLYDEPQGNRQFINALTELLREEYQWPVHPDNIALTNGSQAAFFMLFNLFAGAFADGARRKILFPLIPEYIGYADVGLEDDFFIAQKPKIEFLEDHFFKYHIDFENLNIRDDVGAICVSRPTNPTGNVLTDSEIDKLKRLSREHNIPLIIDNAYGTPFPNIIFTDAKPIWDENTIICMSLSKFGLPATRTGILLAPEEVISALAGMSAVLNLAPGSIGSALALPLVKSREIITLSKEVIRPYYQNKNAAAILQLQEELSGLDYYIHNPEGAFFLWLWLRELPITALQLYERLKQQGVLVVPGNYFFPGLRESWKHADECIRISYAQDDNVVRAGIKIIADETRKLYCCQSR